MGGPLTDNGLVLLEVIALNPADARAAEVGGAGRVELVGTMADDGLAPSPELVAQVCRAVAIPVRAMVRLTPGFVVDAALRRLLASRARAFADAGAAGLVVGFLDPSGRLDVDALTEVVGATGLPWTLHRAIDHAADQDAAWGVLTQLDGLDQVLTAGSPHGVDRGAAALIARATAHPDAARLMMAGGGLASEHVPRLAAAGIRAFHIGSAARPGRTFTASVDERLVTRWRALLTAEPGVSAG